MAHTMVSMPFMMLQTSKEKEGNVPRAQMKREDDKERKYGKEREDWKLDAGHPCRRKVEEKADPRGLRYPGRDLDEK